MAFENVMVTRESYQSGAVPVEALRVCNSFVDGREF